MPVLIGAGLIYILYSGVDLDKAKETLSRDVNYLWFIPVICVSIMSHVFRAMRWRLQLRAIDVKAPLHPVVNSIFGTYAVNLLFPRLGEVWRCGYIAKREDAPFTKVVGSMVADRLSDTVIVLLLTLGAFLLAQDAFTSFFASADQGGEPKQGLLAMIFTSWQVWVAIVVVTGLLVWLFTCKRDNRIVRKIIDIVKGMWEGFASIARMEGKWWFLLYTLLIWGCYFMQLYIATKAFTFTSDLSVQAVFVMFVLSSIGMGVPTNGGLGAWHMAIIFGLSLYGVGEFSATNPDTQASTFAMLVWGIQTLLLIVLGVYAYVNILREKKTKAVTTNEEE